MPINESLIAEFQQEAASTRKILERVQEKDFSWKPHEKSMSLGELSHHLAEISTWTGVTIEQEEFDFSKMDYKPPVQTTTANLLKFFDDNLNNALDTLKKASDEKLSGTWTMKNGDKVYFTLPKMAVIRSFVLSHTIHHRGQLSVYLRLLGIPLPQIYGPTADESSF